MAELTAARNNALPYPVYGLPWVVTFPLLDADGDPTAPSSPDSEVSLNCDSYADCTNEAVEIGNGSCYLILTAAEMTADVVTVQVKSTGAKTTVLTLYPRKLPIIASGTAQGGADTSHIQLASNEVAVDDYYNGCLVFAGVDGVEEARMIIDYVGSTKVCEVTPAFVTAIPDSNDSYEIYLPEGRQVEQANVQAVSGTAVTWSATRGLAGTALPAAAADAAGGLIISDAGGLDADAQLVTKINDILTDTGTTLDGKIDAIKTKTDFLPNATAGTAGGVFIAGTNAATVVTTSFTTTFTGNLTGSVGSVVGAVGSVTGAVGSVTAAVTVGTNNDKTGYTLSSAGQQALVETCFTYDATATYATANSGSLVAQIVDNASGGGGGSGDMTEIDGSAEAARKLRLTLVSE